MQLLIDDLREPGIVANGISIPEDASVCRTVSEGIEFLRHNKVTTLYLDHDLGDVKETGYDVLLWLEHPDNHQFLPESILLVTSNPSAREKMKVTIEAIYRLASKDTLFKQKG
jgi:hypothetical protein